MDWGRLVPLVEKGSGGRGRPPEYSGISMLKVVVLQELEEIIDDTEMERRLKDNEDYRGFCGLTNSVPSHDTISRFKRDRNPRALKRVFLEIDSMLEELGYFDGDELSADGTDIELGVNEEIGSWGAKSDKEKFFGLWLMTANSTKRELSRDYVLDEAEIGQIELGKELLRFLSGRDIECSDISMDGIFDGKEVRKMIADMGKTPVIPYNPRKSKIKEAKDLPDSNWRLEHTPFQRDEEKFKRRYKCRTASERENSRIKGYTSIGRLEEKMTRSPRMKPGTIRNQVAISLIALQVSALAQYVEELKMPVYVQKRLDALAMA